MRFLVRLHMKNLADGADTANFYLWVLHGLHRAVKGRTQRRKTDEHVHVGVLLHGFTHVFIDRDEDLFMAPVELLLVVSAERRNEKKRALTSPLPFDEMYKVSEGLREGVNHGRNRRLLSGADVVKVQHALHRSRLHPPNYCLGMFAKKGC